MRIISILTIFLSVTFFAETKQDISNTTKLQENNRLIINIIGPPGSGKGTQSSFLSKKYNLKIISMGDMMRKEIQKANDLGKILLYHSKISNNYAPEEIAYGILASNISKEDYKKGFILDGFPRMKSQAIVFNNAFLKPDDIFINIILDVEDSILYERIKKRLICPKCVLQVREHEKSIKNPNRCMKCNGELQMRKDDVSDEIIKKRLEFYRNTTFPMIEELNKNNYVTSLKIEETDSPFYVFQKIEEIIEDYLKKFR